MEGKVHGLPKIGEIARPDVSGIRKREEEDRQVRSIRYTDEGRLLLDRLDQFQRDILRQFTRGTFDPEYAASVHGGLIVLNRIREWFEPVKKEEDNGEK